MSQFCLRERTAIQSKGRIADTLPPFRSIYGLCVVSDTNTFSRVLLISMPPFQLHPRLVTAVRGFTEKVREP